MSLEAVIFDYGKVISLDQDAECVAEMRRLSGLDEQTFHHLYWKHRDAYDAGAFTGPFYWQTIAGEAGVAFTSSQLAALVDADNRSWSRTSDLALRWAGELAASGFKLGILSNMHRDLRDHLERTCPWVRDFHHTVFSCDVGMIKPEEPIYRLAVDGLGVPPARALFLDDREPNILAAQRVGLQGIVVDDLPDAIRQASDRFGLPVASLSTPPAWPGRAPGLF